MARPGSAATALVLHPHQSAGHDDHAPRRRRLEDRAPARRPDHVGSTSRISHSAVARQEIDPVLGSALPTPLALRQVRCGPTRSCGEPEPSHLTGVLTMPRGPSLRLSRDSEETTCPRMRRDGDGVPQTGRRRMRDELARERWPADSRLGTARWCSHGLRSRRARVVEP